MKLIADFKNFLDVEVNLNPTRLKTLDERVSAITNFLSSANDFEDHYVDVIPQGSFAHKTIIKPVRENDEFDADVLLHLAEFEDWDAEDYVKKVYDCFRVSPRYKDKVILGKRCVTINYANDFHIDVVPYLERHGKKYITCRPKNEFQLTDPEAYNAWLNEKNRTTNRNLVKVIRLMKFLRNYKGTFNVKSVVLNVLLGNQVNGAALLSDPGCYSDVSTTLRTVMNRLSAYVSLNETLPSIMDPSGTYENLSDRWNQDSYASFRKAVIRYASWIEDAWSDTEASSSREKWQKIFGDGFGKPEIVVAAESMSKSFVSPSPITKTEQTLEDVGIVKAINLAYRFRIGGKVQKLGSMGTYYLGTRGNKVLPGRSISFQIEECNVPEPYKIFWKVCNRGQEAIRQDCIRGQIEEGGRVWKQLEPTSFGGSHYVECYIVKDGRCVASNRQEVNILHRRNEGDE